MTEWVPEGGDTDDDDEKNDPARPDPFAPNPQAAPADAMRPQSAAAKLFDLRLLIGGLFIVYGVLLTIYSFFDSPVEIEKSAGIHLNLWMGLAMLVVGIVFGVWARLQPPKPPPPPEDADLGRPAAHH